MSAKFKLLVLGFLSLGLIVVVDRSLYNLFQSILPLLAVIPDLRISSLLLISLLAWRFDSLKANDLNPPEIKLRSALITSIIWLSMTGYFVLVQRVWVPKLSDWIDFTAFMVTGLLAEEILFRGVLFKLSLDVFKDRRIFRLSYAIWISAILFALSHLAYHGFELTAASMTQVGYTLMMGLVFGYVRFTTGRLWPVIVLHMVNNSFTVMRNFGWSL